MDNQKLEALRREYSRGFITAEELRLEVVRSCNRFAVPDIHQAVGGELALIHDEGLRHFTYKVLAMVPNYYWHIPASILGFHDIHSDNEIGGLVAHSRKVARVARTMVEPYNKEFLADDFVVAGLLHDAWKYGLDGLVPRPHDHATFAADWLASKNIYNDRPEIRNVIRTHMGRWGVARPDSDVEWAFHLADYMVSRGAVPLFGTNGSGH